MSEYKRTWPKKSKKGVQGFFYGAEALALSLEAAGLAAHIYSFDADDIDEEYLRGMFPDRDLTGPLRELASIGLIEFVEPGTPAPVVDVETTDQRYRAAGVIYLVEGGGRFKIGIAKSAKARLTSLQTGSPVPLKLVHSAFVNDCVRAEQLAHGLLARYRLHGEWFECSKEQGLNVLNTVIEAVGEGPTKK